MFKVQHSRSVQRTLLVLCLLFAAPNSWGANDFKSGMEALEQGNPTLAIEYWKPLAEAGDPDAQFGMAAIYNDGMGVVRNYAEANYWLLRAADQGYAAAQYNLGNAYKNGTGMAVDPAMAAIWWRKAAEQEFTPAQFNLGSAFIEGAGVVRDYAAGLEWYRRAAANGHAQAQSNLEALGESLQADAKPAAPAKPTPTIAAPAPTPAAPTPAAPTPAAPTPAAPAPVTAETNTATKPPIVKTPVITTDSQSGECTDLLNQAQHSHTLQLMASQNEAAARAYITQHALSETAICNYKVKGARWFALLYGRFESADQARDALEALPIEVRTGGGYIRRVSVIRNLTGVGTQYSLIYYRNR